MSDVRPRQVEKPHLLTLPLVGLAMVQALAGVSRYTAPDAAPPAPGALEDIAARAAVLLLLALIAWKRRVPLGEGANRWIRGNRMSLAVLGVVLMLVLALINPAYAVFALSLSVVALVVA